MDYISSRVSKEVPIHVEDDGIFGFTHSYSLYEWILFAQQSDQVITRIAHHKRRWQWYQHDYVLITVESPQSQPEETPKTVMITRTLQGNDFLSLFSTFGEARTRFSVLASESGKHTHVPDVLVGEPLTWTREKAPSLKDVTVCLLRMSLLAHHRLILPNHCRTFTSSIVPIIRKAFNKEGVMCYTIGVNDFYSLMGIIPAFSVKRVVDDVAMWFESGKMFGATDWAI